MAYSRNTYVADGTTDTFSLSFTYLSPAYVYVTVDGVAVPQGDLVWLTSASIKLPTTPASGKVVKLYRQTPKSTPLVVFADGPLGARSLNRAFSGLLHIVQEQVDDTDEVKAIGDNVLTYLDEMANYYNQCVSLAAAAASAASSAAADAVASVQSTLAGYVTAAQGYASTATTKAGEAADSAGAAAASAATAATFDPSSYYPKTDFKSDGTAGAPVLYTPSGQLMAVEVDIDRTAGTNKWLQWKTDGVPRWTMKSDTTDAFAFSAYSDAGALLGNVFTVNRLTQDFTFTKTPRGPTPTAGDNTTKLATTAYVQGELAGAGAWTLISEQNPSGAAAVIWTDLSAYSELRLDFYEVTTTSTGTANPVVQLSSDNGSTWLTSGYVSRSLSGSSASVTASAGTGTALFSGLATVSSGLTLAGQRIGGSVYLHRVNDAARRTTAEGMLGSSYNGEHYVGTFEGRHDTAAAHNALRVLMSTGNVAGTLALWGRK
jgi:hypothetical protein